MKKRTFINIVLTFVVIIALGLGGYFYYKLNNFQSSPKDKKDKEVTSLINTVGELYLFPNGESPTVATVSDPEALKSQAFFAGALKDDKVLIFSESGKAVLFRPSINKIIDITSVKK